MAEVHHCNDSFHPVQPQSLPRVSRPLLRFLLFLSSGLDAWNNVMQNSTWASAVLVNTGDVTCVSPTASCPWVLLGLSLLTRGHQLPGAAGLRESVRHCYSRWPSLTSQPSVVFKHDCCANTFALRAVLSIYLLQ